jgi:prolyl-tRNA synthetase
MKFSQSYLPTYRDAPSDAEVVSHQKLVQAGYIRKVGLGIFDLLPLGIRSVQKIEKIVREEMNKSGAQEVLMPHMVPSELWEESGRWNKYGKELLRIRDRHEREYCFGPTHEEVICEMVRNEASSYRHYPFNLYQIQTKFRDEIRPRFGLMRGREFIMKDAYSFHTDSSDLDREYDVMFKTYQNIFERLGLAFKAVEADNGSIGGSGSHEFMVLADTGEDAIANCHTCDYAANLEKAVTKHEASSSSDHPAMETIDTPDQKTIEEVCQFLKINPKDTIKSLLYKTDDSWTMLCLPGNKQVSDIKLGNVTNANELRLASHEEVLEVLGVATGSLSPVGLKTDVKIIYDESLKRESSYTAGANESGKHLKNVVIGRDLEIKEYHDFTEILEGDTCPRCEKGKLEILRGIEVGHIFKLGDLYSKSMNVSFLNKEGKSEFPVMGCYGIGITRVLAACVEQNHDDKGMMCPKAIAPFDIHLLTMGPEEELTTAASDIYKSLTENGFDVLWDDRDERAGVKFNDADLMGNPLHIVIGRKSLAKGEVEYKIRKTGERGTLPLNDVLNQVKQVWETVS